MGEPIQIAKGVAMRTWTLAMWLVGSVFIVYLLAVLPTFEKGTADIYSGLEKLRRAYYGPNLGLLPHLAALFFLWRNRSNLALTPTGSEPSIAGLAIVTVGAMVFVGSARLQDPRLGMLSIPILWMGLGWSIDGWRAAKALCFPAILLLFVIPLPGYLIAEWKTSLFASRISYSVINLLGADATLAGPLISSKDGSWMFMFDERGADGLISPLLVIFVAIISAKLMLIRVWQQIALVASCLALALLLRIFHLSIGLVLAEHFNADLAGKFLHDGYVKFVFAVIWIACLIILGKWLRPVKQISVRRQRQSVTR